MTRAALRKLAAVAQIMQGRMTGCLVTYRHPARISRSALSLVRGTGRLSGRVRKSTAEAR